MSTLWNFLAAEQGIAERLAAVTQKECNGIPAWCKKILTRQQMAQLSEDRQVVPAIFVIYAGETVLDVNNVQTLEGHRFNVVLAVAEASNQRTASRLNEQAGTYMAIIKAALKNYTPAGAMGPLVQTTPPPPYYSTGYAYYPATFEARVLFSNRFGPGIAPPSQPGAPLTATKVK